VDEALLGRHLGAAHPILPPPLLLVLLLLVVLLLLLLLLLLEMVTGRERGREKGVRQSAHTRVLVQVWIN